MSLSSCAQRFGPVVTHRFDLQSVGIDLRAVDRHHAQLQQLQFLRQQQHLGKRGRKGRGVLAPERGDGIMVGRGVGGDEANRNIAVCRPLDPARGENAVGVAVDQQRQHQPRVVLCLASAPPVDLERTDVDALDSFDDEMRKLVLWNPLAKVGRQKKSPRAIMENEIGHGRTHKLICPQIRQTAR